MSTITTELSLRSTGVLHRGRRTSRFTRQAIRASAEAKRVTRPWADTQTAVVQVAPSAISRRAAMELRKPASIDTIDDLVLAYGPRHDRAVDRACTGDAWIGDRLLYFALSLLLVDEAPVSIGRRMEINSTVARNAFLSEAFSCSWPGARHYGSIHSRGTVVEAALCRLYRDRGMEPVLKLTRFLVSRAIDLKPEILPPLEAAIAASSMHEESTIANRPLFDRSGMLVGYVTPEGQEIRYSDDHRKAANETARPTKSWTY